jgi:hypothetical protein
MKMVDNLAKICYGRQLPIDSGMTAMSMADNRAIIGVVGGSSADTENRA